MTRPRGSSWWTSGRWIGGGFVLLALGGCQLFPQKSTTETTRTANRTMLSQLKPGKDAIQMDILIIDRRADDPLLGTLLWQEVDQVGAVVPGATRELLLQNGCLVGQVASKPPLPLLQLLGVVPEIEGISAESLGRPKPKVAGRKYSIRSGTESEIQVSDVLPEAELTIVDADRSRAAQFEQVRFLFRVKPIRLQDGWVRVEFVPEIHHGDMQLRPTPTDELGWTLKSTQHVEQCYPQQFAVTLNVGESALITAAPSAEGTLGDRFFRRDQNGERRQRLMVVRLADMGRTPKPVD